jgi:hypothetical protein
MAGALWKGGLRGGPRGPGMSDGGTRPRLCRRSPEGQPAPKPAEEDAAYFLRRMVH